MKPICMDMHVLMMFMQEEKKIKQKWESSVLELYISIWQTISVFSDKLYVLSIHLETIKNEKKLNYYVWEYPLMQKP